jgi:peptide methionine sulfoxide reductase msrA/msrB
MNKEEYKKLTPEEESVIVNKETEKPFSGKYDDFYEQGTYICKRCGAELYRSENKFDAHCGWPSFDDAILGAIKQTPDADGERIEIICNNCEAHLGHAFTGEKMTDKNTRFCVNSISMDFIPDENHNMKTIYFAGGCFWGVEYHFQNLDGVIETEVGYMGGTNKTPTYEQVSTGTTGYAETLKVIYNESKINFEKLVKLFFEIHDFTQINRQGPDIGEQYRSVIFYTTNEQGEISEKIINLLKEKRYKVATKLQKATTFWSAEDYHQKYYVRKGGTPYCHIRNKIF